MMRIQEVRRKNGYTQSKLAAYLNVSRSTIAMWETSRCEPNTEQIGRMSDLFSVTTDYLLGFSEDPTPPKKDSIIDEVQGMDPDQKRSTLIESFASLPEDRKDQVLEYIEFLRSKDSSDEG